MADAIYVGVDIGGTAIKICACDQTGRVLHQMEHATEVELGAEVILAKISQTIQQVVEQSGASFEQVASIGVGVPGLMDIEQGIVKNAPNLKWRDVPIRAILEHKLNKPIVVDNDANSAAFGEAWIGAGKGFKHLVCYTLGTGVGGGIIIDGALYRGLRGMAGELGHIYVVPDLEAIQCGCGMKGCLETVSSATGIVRMAQEAVARGERTDLALLTTITAKDVCEAAKGHDDVAMRIIQRAGFYIGKSMAMVAITLTPERFIVGGGVSRAGEILLDPIREGFQKYTPNDTFDDIDIVTATLGNDAGMIGAAGLAMLAKRGLEQHGGK